ncbi:MAG: PIN domain-containing protein [Opitutae bacterium]|nr:PIN domain-containing protein [Opitutae bacterium]
MKALAQPSYLVDAGPLIALFARRDRWHGWARDIFFSITEPLWTGELVVCEVAWNLGQNTAEARELLSFIHRGELGALPILGQHAARLGQLMAKYERMDVCDGSLVVLSEQFPKARIITVDTRDFPVYRRFGREPLPLIMPE